jgi:hypothetical protein
MPQGRFSPDLVAQLLDPQLLAAVAQVGEDAHA